MSSYFYVDQYGQKQGPINDQILKDLAAQGLITPHTQLETDTEHKGVAGQIPGLKFATQSMQANQGPQGVPNTANNAPAIQEINSYFKIYWTYAVFGLSLGIAAMVMIIFGAIMGAVIKDSGGDQSVAMGILGIGVFACFVAGILLLIAWIYEYILLYKLWKLIPSNIARTTPGKAIGFCFIPFFNLYWMFVAFKGLGEDMNKVLIQRGIAYRVNEELGLIYCILICAAIIPNIGILISLANMIVCIYFFKSVKNGAVLLLEQGGQSENNQYGPHQDDVLTWILPVSTSAWAVAAGYVGLFAVLLFPAPIALVLGIIALRDCKRRTVAGKGRAIFAIVMGVVFTLLLSLIMLPAIQ